MKWTCTLIVAAVLGLAGIAPAWAGELEDEQADVFDILSRPGGKNEDSSVGGAVDPLDRVVQKSRRGERQAVGSNLDYNLRKIKELRKQAAAQESYISNLWERVAIQFESLKARFGDDEKSPAYRKAALALREEYEQREAEARRKLKRLNEEIGHTEARTAELTNRKKMHQLEDELRNTDLGAKRTFGKAERPALPSRATGALAALGDLSKRKVQHRLDVLVGSATVRSSAEDYFDRQIQDMLASNRK